MATNLTKEKKPLYILPRLALVFALFSACFYTLAEILVTMDVLSSVFMNWSPVKFFFSGIYLIAAALICVACIIFFFLIHKIKFAEKYPRWLAIPVLLLSCYFFFPVFETITYDINGGHGVFTWWSYYTIGSYLYQLLSFLLPIIFTCFPLIILGICLLFGKKKSVLVTVLAVIPVIVVGLDNLIFTIEFVMGLLGIRLAFFGYYIDSFRDFLYWLPSIGYRTMNFWVLVALFLLLLPGKKKKEIPPQETPVLDGQN